MAIVKWDGSFATGIHMIDEQHKSLFEIVNNLQEKMHTRASRASLLTTLDSMKQYARFHFETEERLMEKYEYPGTEYHKLEHKEFSLKTEELFWEVNEKDIPALFVESLTYLLNWIVKHVAGSDRKYAPFLKGRIPRDMLV